MKTRQIIEIPEKLTFQKFNVLIAQQHYVFLGSEAGWKEMEPYIIE